MKKGVYFAPLALSCLLLSGCNITKTLDNAMAGVRNMFSSPEVPVTYMRPADKSGTVGMRRIAIMEKRNDNVVPFMETNLTGVQVNSTPYFTLVDRSTIQKVLDEQKFSDGLLADSSTRVKFGKLTGADTVLTGTLGANISSSSFTKTVRRCSDDDCDHHYDAKVRCRKHTAIASFQPKAVSVETGRIIFSENYTRKAETTSCDGEGDALLSDSELRGKAYAIIAHDFIADIAPHEYVVNVELIESDDSDKPDMAEKYFDMGIDLANKQSFGKACTMFERAQSQFAKSLALNYNLGVCARARSRT